MFVSPQTFRLAFVLPALVQATSGGRFTSSQTQDQRNVARAASWGIVPEEPVAIYIDDTVHYQVSGEQASVQWQSLLPATGHLVHDNNHLPQTVAMFHQLECLDNLRKAFFGKNVTAETRKCFNYLQQSVLCHSDRRLESIRWVGKANVISVAGYWKCRNWEALYQVPISISGIP